MELRLAMLYGGKVEGMKQRSGWLHPTKEFYDVGRMGATKKSKAQAVGTVIHGRIVNGPELNIPLLGIPFIISSIYGAIRIEVKEKSKKSKAKAAAARPVAEREGSTKEFKLKVKAPTKPENLQSDALPSAPYSAEFAKVRQELVDLGMSPDMATALVKGEFESQSPEDVLSDTDLDALIAFMERYSD